MAIIQDILITILAGYMAIDQNGPVVLSWFSVIVGMISGLIMGDMNTGLVIGGTFQLMSLGVAALGVYRSPHRNRYRCGTCSRSAGWTSCNPAGSCCPYRKQLCGTQDAE